MNEDESMIARSIVENVELLEKALQFEQDQMSKALSGAVPTAFEENIRQLGWRGKVGKDFEGDF